MISSWQRFEEYIAELFDGKRQKGSGNGEIAKGDVLTEKFLFECKWTQEESYRLHENTWKKIIEEAMLKDKIPVFTSCAKNGIYFVISPVDLDNTYIDKYNHSIRNKSYKLTDDLAVSHSLYCFENGLPFVAFTEKDFPFIKK